MYHSPLCFWDFVSHITPGRRLNKEKEKEEWKRQKIFLTRFIDDSLCGLFWTTCNIKFFLWFNALYYKRIHMSKIKKRGKTINYVYLTTPFPDLRITSFTASLWFSYRCHLLDYGGHFNMVNVDYLLSKDGPPTQEKWMILCYHVRVPITCTSLCLLCDLQARKTGIHDFVFISDYADSFFFKEVYSLINLYKKMSLHENEHSLYFFC